MMIHILKTSVGLIVILIVLSIMLTPFTFDSNEGFGQALSDGFEAALILIQFSILCTAGISLFAWMVCSYIVGHITIYGVSYIVIGSIYLVSLGIETFTIGSRQRLDPQKGKLLLLTDRLNQELQSGFSLNREQLALLNYIKKARTKGLNDARIVQNLTYNGWPTDSIATAFQMTGNG